MAQKAKIKIRSKGKNRTEENSFYDQEGNKLWIVEKLVTYKKVEGKYLYFVKWLGWSETENTWEPEENLAYVKEMIQELKKQQNLPENDEENRQSGTGSKHVERTERDKGLEGEEVEKSRLCKQSKKIRKETGRVLSKNPKPYVICEDEDKSEENKMTEKDYGNFGCDKVEMIEDHAVYAGDRNFCIRNSVKVSNLMFKVKWSQRSSGVRPLSTWYGVDDIKVNCADKLVNYYEKFLNFSE